MTTKTKQIIAAIMFVLIIWTVYIWILVASGVAFLIAAPFIIFGSSIYTFVYSFLYKKVTK